MAAKAVLYRKLNPTDPYSVLVPITFPLASQLTNAEGTPVDVIDGALSVVIQGGGDPAPISGEVSISGGNMAVTGKVEIDGNVPVTIADAISVISFSQLINVEHDEKVLSWSGDELTSIVYKKASGTVATLTLTWTNGSLTKMVVT